MFAPVRSQIRKGSPDLKHEIVILAANDRTAQKALNLILSAHRLITAEVWIDDIDVQPQGKTKALHPGYCSTANFPVACHIAAKASTSLNFIYALALYRLSQELHVNVLMDLEPREYPHEHRSPYPRDHARFAYAIVTAYAVIEQIGLALKQGDAFKNRQWIPVVRNELENRLRSAGVDLGNPVLWQLRGGKTKMEARRPPKIMRKASWAFGKIRDCEVEVIDALADLRWLRSGVASHHLDELASLLSIYDASNAQLLARRLLFDRLGFTAQRVWEIREASTGKRRSRRSK